MRRTAWNILALIFAFGLMFSVAACSSDKPKPDDKASGSGGTSMDCQSCADCKKAGHGWCDHCGKGYCEGKATTCPICAKAGKFDDGCAASCPKPCSECSAKIKQQ